MPRDKRVLFGIVGVAIGLSALLGSVGSSTAREHSGRIEQTTTVSLERDDSTSDVKTRAGRVYRRLESTPRQYVTPIFKSP